MIEKGEKVEVDMREYEDYLHSLDQEMPYLRKFRQGGIYDEDRYQNAIVLNRNHGISPIYHVCLIEINADSFLLQYDYVPIFNEEVQDLSEGIVRFWAPRSILYPLSDPLGYFRYVMRKLT